MSFDDTAREPEQTFSLNRDPVGELEYPTKYGRGQGVGRAGAAPWVLLPPWADVSRGRCLSLQLKAARGGICLPGFVLPR